MVPYMVSTSRTPGSVFGGYAREEASLREVDGRGVLLGDGTT